MGETNGRVDAQPAWSCPACWKSGVPVRVRRIHEFTIVRCANCDIVFADPMRNPGPDWYAKIKRIGVGSLRGRFSWYHRQFFNNPPIRRGRILEIGFGTGTFLPEAKGMGFDVVGIDFDERMVSLVRSRGLREVYCATLEQFLQSWDGCRFDVAVFFEVLEHVENPGWFLDALRGILSPAGYIVLSVPNRERLPNLREEWDEPPHHLSWWSKSSLQRVLTGHGYRVSEMKTGGVDPVGLGYLMRRNAARAFHHWCGRVGGAHLERVASKLVPAQGVMTAARQCAMERTRADSAFRVAGRTCSLADLVTGFYALLGCPVAIGIGATGTHIYAIARVD